MSDFVSRGHLAISRDIFGCYVLRRGTATGTCGGRDAVKLPTVHKIAPTTVSWPQVSVVLRLRPSYVLYKAFNISVNLKSLNKVYDRYSNIAQI